MPQELPALWAWCAVHHPPHRHRFSLCLAVADLVPLADLSAFDIGDRCDFDRVDVTGVRSALTHAFCALSTVASRVLAAH